VRRYRWTLALALVLAAAVPLVLGGRALPEELGRFPWPLFLALLGMIVLAWNLNAARIRLLLHGAGRPLGQGRALAVLMATEFAICATPGGAGGPLALVALLRREGVPGARAAAVYAVDQLMDMVFFLTALVALAAYGLTRAVVPHPGWQLALPAGLLGGGLLALLLLVRHDRAAIQVAGRVQRALRLGRLRGLASARRLLRFRRAVRSTLGLPRRRLLAVYLLCTGHWLLRYTVLYLVVRGLGVDLDWGYTFLAQMLSLTAGQASLMPGGAGGTEVAAGALLGAVMPLKTAATAILVWRLVTYYWYLVAGGAVFAWTGGRALWGRVAGGRHAEAPPAATPAPPTPAAAQTSAGNR
jgi:glycosyltransferase 2 family protein